MDSVLGAVLLPAGPLHTRPALCEDLHGLRCFAFPGSSMTFRERPRDGTCRRNTAQRAGVARGRSPPTPRGGVASEGRTRAAGPEGGDGGAQPASGGGEGGGRGRRGGAGAGPAAAPPAEWRAGTAPARRRPGWSVSAVAVAVAVTVASARLWRRPRLSGLAEGSGPPLARGRLAQSELGPGGEVAAAGRVRPSSSSPDPGDCGLRAAPGRRPRQQSRPTGDGEIAARERPVSAGRGWARRGQRQPQSREHGSLGASPPALAARAG